MHNTQIIGYIVIRGDVHMDVKTGIQRLELLLIFLCVVAGENL